MRRPRRITTAAATTALAAGVLLGTGPATAAPPTSITEPIDYMFTVDDFCDVAGLTVEIVGTGEERLHIAERRGETYFSANLRLEQTLTNTATGAFITTREISHYADLHVTDNGDGTLTIVNFGTGFAMLFDSEGQIISKNTGQSRFETVVDLNGTPDDFEDDTVVSEEQILGSTGTNDDFCGPAVDALT